MIIAKDRRFERKFSAIIGFPLQFANDGLFEKILDFVGGHFTAQPIAQK